MADLIKLHPGAFPWLPDGHEHQLLEVFHEYDMPLVGVVDQDGVQYVFHCAAGEMGPSNLWTYSLVDAAEVAALRAAGAAREVLDEIIVSRSGVLALASDDGDGPRILLATHYEAGAQGLREGLYELGRLLEEHLENVTAGRATLGKTLALLG